MCQGIEKMKVLIITVAGMSSRFSQSVGHDVVKSLYYSHNFSESLLYRLVHQPVDFDKYIIVGGYKYKELVNAVSEYFPEMEEKIEMVENPEYMELGSGYSLYCGLKKPWNMMFQKLSLQKGICLLTVCLILLYVSVNKM